MSAASYNRGSRAISAHITQGLRELRERNDHPLLPIGWEIHYTASLIAVFNAEREMVHREFVPYSTRPDTQRALNRALDPCLRHVCPADGGHAANGFQLHYPRK